MLSSVPRWFWKNYQYVLAFLFAIEEINKNPNLLPNNSLGSDIYNALPSEHRTVENALLWLCGGNQFFPNYNCQNQKKSIAIVAGTTSTFSAQIETLLVLYKIPQVTYGPFDPILSDKDQFTSLYQMATMDSSLVYGIITLLLHFGWAWVALFVSDDMKGEQFLRELKAEMVKKDICVAFTEKPLSIMKLYGLTFTILNRIRDSSKRIIPGFAQFINSLNPYQYTEDFYFSKFWINLYNCPVEWTQCEKSIDCPPNVSLEFIEAHFSITSTYESSYFIYNAVYAVAHVLHKMLVEKIETGSTGDTDQPMLLPWQLHPFLKKIQFTNSAGDHVSLDEQRKQIAHYDIKNIVKSGFSGTMVKVGEFSSSPHTEGLVIDEMMIKWPAAFKEVPLSVCSQRCGPGFRKIPKKGKPPCCYSCGFCPETEISNQTDTERRDTAPQQYPNNERTHCLSKSVTFLAFEDALGMALTCMALCLFVLTAVTLGVFVKHRDTPIVKANNRALSYTLLIALHLCFLCSLLFIGRPNTATCILQQISFGVVFTVAVSSVLAKTITVILAFRAVKTGKTLRWLLLSGAPNFVIPICSLIQMIICGIWLGLSPPFLDTDSVSEPKHLVMMCNKGSATAFYFVLGYLGSLALGSFTVAFLARNLPDTFNEAKFLTFSMLLFCSVWVTFLPVYHSTKGKVMVAVEVFSILASSAGLLGCIFAPKCYIILIHSDKNTLKGLKNRNASRGNEHF
ncbi:vomeronasal type-2 receptor 116 [Tupaia chinensis]|uniref:vomeronasal type-2 receptor 116 n=1 Tax=Tupaia chinensis TaxID=246437 RepID=UPI000FFB478A|nr:vomeronasal type-2 receptor 116 [Tupaia chinensis]